MSEPKMNVQLAEMIKSLRHELESARTEGTGKAVAFEVEKIELELTVAISRNMKGAGGVKFWVVSADASVDHETERTHSFKLALTPLDAEQQRRLQVAKEADSLPDKSR